MKTKILFLLAIIFAYANTSNAQMDCRSMLGAHLTPIKKDAHLLWGIEATMAPGIMTSPYDSLDKTQLNGGMILAAFDYEFGKQKHHFYFALVFLLKI